jgi:hypothetical protein
VGATALLVALLILLARPQPLATPGTPAPGTRVISVPTLPAAPTATAEAPGPTATVALPPTPIIVAPTVEPTEVTEVLTGTANVASLEVRTLESFPVQLQVVAQGMLPNPCTAIDPPRPERDGATFRVTLTTSQPLDKACIQQLVPFEQTIPLDVAGLKAGTYTVIVNDASTTFTLDVDNVAP